MPDLPDSWKAEEEAVLRECLFILQGLDGHERLKWKKCSATVGRMLHPLYLLAEEKLVLTTTTTTTTATATTATTTTTPDADATPAASVLEHDTSAILPPSWLAKSRLGSGYKDTLALCAEAGWMYRRVHLYIDSILAKDNNIAYVASSSYSSSLSSSSSSSSCSLHGSVARALCCALRLELRDYLQFLTQLEQDLDRLHLRQIRVRLVARGGFMRKLQSLAVLVDSLQHLQGGPLLRALRMHATHSGDERHVALVHRLLAAASQPWYHMLYQWTTEGILSDPAGEFFVRPSNNFANALLAATADPVALATSSTATHNNNFDWKGGFVLKRSKLPSPGIMDDDLVETAFRVGKGINFVRACLQDGEWTLGKDFMLRAKQAFCYHHHDHNENSKNHSSSSPSASCSFRSTLTEAMRIVHKHILDSLHHDHHLMLHLYALKQFMFLGQGDFYSALMDGLMAEFGHRRGAAGIYRYTLASIVETALKSTNANTVFPAHIQDRLIIEADDVGTNDFLYAMDTSLLVGGALEDDDHDDDHRRIWDIFALGYSVPNAMMAIVDDVAKKDYRRVFDFVFGLKTVEHLLNSTWRTSATLQHALHAVAQLNSITVANSPPYADVVALLRQIAMTRQAMVHFVVNLKTYIMFEILEGGWKNLLHDIQHAETLDDIVAAHGHYLRSICRKCFLGTSTAATTTTTSNNDNHKHPTNTASTTESLAGDVKLGDQVTELLDLCKEFCDYQEQIFAAALDAAERAKAKRQEASEKTDGGAWGFEDLPLEEKNFLGLVDAAKSNDLATISISFHNKVTEFVAYADDVLNGVSLAPRTPKTITPYYRHSLERNGRVRHDDALASLRFLTFQLDMNGYYETNHPTT